MAVRTPLKLDGTNLKEMSASDIGKIVSRMAYLYMIDQTVTLSVVGSGGSLDFMNDTRTLAGAMVSNNTAFTNNNPPGVSTFTVEWDKINESLAGTSIPEDTNNILYPIYNDSGNIKAMSRQDMYDTFVVTAIDEIKTALPYQITDSATPPSGFTNIGSGTAVFTDTSADVSEYTPAGIGETLDQPENHESYYLHKNNGTIVFLTGTPLYIDSNKNLREYTGYAYPHTGGGIDSLDNALKSLIKYTSENNTSMDTTLGVSKLRYYIVTSITSGATQLGTGMVNSKYNSQTSRQDNPDVSGDDYRSQIFPAGTREEVTTYYLEARKE